MRCDMIEIDSIHCPTFYQLPSIARNTTDIIPLTQGMNILLLLFLLLQDDEAAGERSMHSINNG